MTNNQSILKNLSTFSFQASVILPSYRRFEPLLNTLDDLQKQTYSDFEIIVVDQNSYWPEEHKSKLSDIKSNPQINWIYQKIPDVVIARNMAVSKSKGEILIFIDDDVKIIDPNFVENHINAFQNPLIHVIVGREHNYSSYSPDDLLIKQPSSIRSNLSDLNSIPHVQGMSNLQQALWFNRDSESLAQVCTFSTCNGSIRKSTFLRVNGFDENYSGNSYGDDYDLILRLNKLGYTGIYVPSIWLIHLRSPMGGLRMSDIRTKRINYIKTFSGFWLFILRHSTPSMFFHLLYHYVFRRTIFLKINLKRPWRQLFIVPCLILGFFRSLWLLWRGPISTSL